MQVRQLEQEAHVRFSQRQRELSSRFSQEAKQAVEGERVILATEVTSKVWRRDEQLMRIELSFRHFFEPLPCPRPSPCACWPLSCPLWRPWKPLLRLASRLFWRRHWSPWYGACTSPRTPPSPLAFPFSPAQGRSQSPSWLHPGQPARPHGPFRQELSRGPAGPLCLFPSPLLLLGLRPCRVEECKAPSEPRAAASRSTAHTARKGGQKRRASGAAEVRQRKRDKNRRRVRRHIKRSMWREIQSQACRYPSDGDEQHGQRVPVFVQARHPGTRVAVPLVRP